MKNTINTKKIVTKIFLILVLAGLLILVLFPLYFVLITSFKSYNDFVLNPLGFSIKQLTVTNYIEVFKQMNFARAIFNSVIVSVVSVVLTVLFSSLIAFAVGVIKFKGSSIFIYVAIVTMFLTGEMTYIPLYLLFKELKIINTIWALLVPAVIGLPGMGILMGTQFIKKIPQELHEVAFMDGASLMQVFLKIDLPMMKPMLSMIAIMTFQSVWSDFFWPMITVMGNKNAHTLPLLLIGFKAADATMYGQYSAGLVIMTLPIVLVYIFLSKYFMEGMASGAVKG